MSQNLSVTKSPKVFSAYTTSTSSTVGGVEVTWNTEFVKDADYTHTTDDTDVTLVSAGVYHIVCNLSYSTTGGAVVEGRVRLDGSDITGSNAFCSHSASGFSSSLTLDLLQSFSAGAVISIFTLRTAGSATPSILAGQLTITRIR